MNLITEKLLETYLNRFANRDDAYYKQWVNGKDFGYCAIYEPVTIGLLKRHIAGDITLAFPALNSNDNCRWICFDSDKNDNSLDKLQVFLEQYNWHYIREGKRLGRDGHLWLLFDATIPAKQLIILGKVMLKCAGLEQAKLELFPKQEHVENLGNAVRAPLGIHKKPGAENCRGWFDVPPQDIKSQLEWLARQPLNSAVAAMQLANAHRTVLKPRFYRYNTQMTKNRIDFVEYARLNEFKQRGNEYVGACPACKYSGHDSDDNHLSINVNSKLFKCWRGCQCIDIVRAIKDTREGAA